MRQDFTFLLYLVYRMVGDDVRAEEKSLKSHISNKWQRGYLEIVGFIWLLISL